MLVVFSLFAIQLLSHGFRFPVKNPWYAPRERLRTSLSMQSDFAEAVLAVPSPSESIDFYRKHLLRSVSSDSVEIVSPFRLRFEQAADSFSLGEDIFGVSLTLNSQSLQTIIPNIPSNNVVRPLGDYSHGASLIPDEDEELDFPVRYGIIKDVDGFAVELHENDQFAEQTCKLTLRVLDLNDSVDFYTKALGFNLLRRRSNVNNKPCEASMCAYVGNESETKGPVLHLLYQYGTDEKLKYGNAFRELKVQTDNLQEMRDRIMNEGVKFEESPDGSIQVRDPTGYQINIQARSAKSGKK